MLSLRRSLSALAGVFALGSLTLPATAQPVVPMEAYARLANAQSVNISPDGTRIAMITGAERDETYALIVPLAGGGEPVAIPGFSQDIDDELLVGVDWLSDRYIIITYRERISVPGQPWEDADVARRVVYDLEQNDYDELDTQASIESLLPGDPDKILVSTVVVQERGTSVMRSRGGGIGRIVNLYSYDMDDQDYDRVAAGTLSTVNWVLGEDARPILRQDRAADDRRWRVYDYDGRRANLIYEETYTVERFGRDGRRAISNMSNLVGEDVQGRGVWFSQLEERDKLRAYLFDPRTGEISGPEIAPEGFDFGGFRTDWRTGKVIGAAWLEERLRTEWFDPEFAALQEQLNGLFPASDVTIESWDRSGQRLIINVVGGNTSSDFYLLDRSSGEMAFLTSAYPEVPPERIHPVSIEHYTARDGLNLWGYLTVPGDRPTEGLPLVIAPHGGPQSRDSYGFDPIFAQPYADMGYAVFQPQFRGSDGMGQDFVRRGHGEWGRLMQSDITDAVAHLVERGVVDEDRVCIWGWSYGGYAALAGWSLTPEVYRCAIAGAPVSDILEMMSWQADQLGGAGAVNYWTEYIGDWRVERDRMVEISPARQAASGDDPLLVIHAREDQVVPFEQAEIMVAAARNAGKDVELVSIDGDGHNLLFARARETTLEAVTAFLMEHNPPDPR